MSLYGVEINPNIRFIGEISNNIIILRTPFELTNDEWVTINSMDLTSNDGNFGINLSTDLEELQSVREYFQGRLYLNSNSASLLISEGSFSRHKSIKS